MALFPDATNLQTFPENGADSWDADGNRIDWSEAAQEYADSDEWDSDIDDHPDRYPKVAIKAASKEYNGWANYETFNVAHCLNNIESLHRAAADLMQKHDNPEDPYELFIQHMHLQDSKTRDGVGWFSQKLDLNALNEMMEDLA
tara:strand:- start:7005 stop:7436 length:432 start_codon:yes stop_codon:yes gene_type:complete